jgi:hypothetical protein
LIFLKTLRRDKAKQNSKIFAGISKSDEKRSKRAFILRGPLETKNPEFSTKKIRDNLKVYL